MPKHMLGAFILLGPYLLNRWKKSKACFELLLFLDSSKNNFFKVRCCMNNFLKLSIQLPKHPLSFSCCITYGLTTLPEKFVTKDKKKSIFLSVFFWNPNDFNSRRIRMFAIKYFSRFQKINVLALRHTYLRQSP